MHLETDDGYRLGCDLFESPTPKARALIASAMGVKRSWYRAFARGLAEAGIECLTLDYRGVGDSLHGPLRALETSLHDWAERDLAAGLRFLRARTPELPLFWIGHSVGGQLLGLMREVDDLKGAVLVASQSGYWRNWHTPLGRSAIFALWNVAIPALTALTGKLPMAALRQGEDVPRGVAREWARWGRHPRYIMRYADPKDDVAFKHFSGPIRSYALSDDNYAPVRSVEALLGYYQKAKTELRLVEPEALGVPGIGHFNFFRERHRKDLWSEARAWLLEQL